MLNGLLQGFKQTNQVPLLQTKGHEWTWHIARQNYYVKTWKSIVLTTMWLRTHLHTLVMWTASYLCVVTPLFVTLSQKQPGSEETQRTVVIQERRLHVGVHNGWCFLDKPQVVVLEPLALGVRGRADSTSKKSTLVKDRWAGETCIVYAYSGAVNCRVCWSIILFHRCAKVFSYSYGISSASPGW